MFFVSLLLITVLSLVLPMTRLYGAIGAVITLYLYPYHTLSLLGLLVLAGLAYLYFNHRRKRHAA